MAYLNFDEERIDLTPIILYVDYINIQYKDYLKKNYDDLTPRDVTYLVNIFYNQDISQRQLSELLCVSESNVTQIIKKLEKNQFLTRSPSNDNKSRKVIHLTEKGRVTTIKLIKLFYERESKFFEKYDDDEIRLFKKMIYDYAEYSVFSKNNFKYEKIK